MPLPALPKFPADPAAPRCPACGAFIPQEDPGEECPEYCICLCCGYLFHQSRDGTFRHLTREEKASFAGRSDWLLALQRHTREIWRERNLWG